MKTVILPDSVPLADVVALCRNHGLRPEWRGNGVYAAVDDEIVRTSPETNQILTSTRGTGFQPESV